MIVEIVDGGPGELRARRYVVVLDGCNVAEIEMRRADIPARQCVGGTRWYWSVYSLERGGPSWRHAPALRTLREAKLWALKHYSRAGGSDA